MHEVYPCPCIADIPIALASVSSMAKYPFLLWPAVAVIIRDNWLFERRSGPDNMTDTLFVYIFSCLKLIINIVWMC